jgi:hypothetical protein
MASLRIVEMLSGRGTDSRREPAGSGGEPMNLLAIYLNDHLAGSTAGVELARRLRGSNEDNDLFAAPLAELCAEIEADRETLKRLMERLDIRRDPVKPVGAWVVEKLGRLKLNGQLRGYSPLSRLVELEGLSIGIAGKARLWSALERTLGDELDGFDFGALAERAVRQRDRVEELHLLAAAQAFPAKARAES